MAVLQTLIQVHFTFVVLINTRKHVSVIIKRRAYSPTAWNLEDDEASEETLSASPAATMENTCCIRDKKMKSIGISGTTDYCPTDWPGLVIGTHFFWMSRIGH